VFPTRRVVPATARRTVSEVRALIVDDEAPARERLRRMLGAEPDVRVVGEADDGTRAVDAIRAIESDIVFLDIQMPGRDGFGVIDEVGPDVMPHVVFITAYDEHALRAFEVRAVDYLLKPISPDRLREAIDRVRERLHDSAVAHTEARGAALHELVEALAPRTYMHRVLVHVDDRAILLPVARIDWIEADRNYVWLHTGGKALPLRQPISAIAERLDPQLFLRINRSVIVRLDAVQEMHPWSHGDYRVVLTDGSSTVWSRRYRARQEGEFGGR
jgi:two-component system LytT family response regulator